MSEETAYILSVSRCKYKFTNIVSTHRHNFHHILYVVAGSGQMTIGQEDYRMQKNDVYVIPPGAFHSFFSDLQHPLQTMEVKCMLQASSDFLDDLPIHMNVGQEKARFILEAMLDEAGRKLPYYIRILNAKLVEFAMILHRSQARSRELEMRLPDVMSLDSSDAAEAGRDGGEDLVARVLRYIQSNYQKKLTLQGISKHFAMNQASLCRLFRERRGISPMQYINGWRLEKSKELLSYTDLTVTEISERSGFGSVHYFSRSFTNKEKMSPLQFRQFMKESVYMTVDETYTIVDSMAVLSSAGSGGL